MEASSAPQDVGLVEASSDQLLPRGRNKRVRCDHSAHARANTVHCVASRVVAARSFIEARKLQKALTEARERMYN